MTTTDTLISWILAGFLVGVVLGGVVPPGLSSGGALLGLSLAVFLLTLLVVRTPARKARYALVALVGVACTLGMLRMLMSASVVPDSDLEAAIGKNIIAEGVVVAEPDVRPLSTRYTMRLDHIETKEGVRNVSGTALVVASRYPEARYGDHIILRGVLVHPKNFTQKRDDATNTRTFDYIAYLKKDGITYQFFQPDVRILGVGEGNSILAQLFAWKAHILSRVDQVLPSPESGLLVGMLLGGKSGLGADLLHAFQVAGIVHLVVLSGYNITLVAEGAFRVLGLFFMRRIAVIASALVVIFFTLMVGASATAVRATAMALVLLFARETGRTGDMVRILFVVGVAMVAINPAILLADPSFQLSFLATFGLLIFTGPIERWLERAGVRSVFWRGMIASTLATQVTVLPLLMYQVGMFPLYALPANLLVLPLAPLIMFSGIAMVAVALLSPTLALPLAALVYVPLRWLIGVAETTTYLPYAQIAVPQIPAWLVVGVYAMGVVYWLRKRLYARANAQAVYARFPLPAPVVVQEEVATLAPIIALVVPLEAPSASQGKVSEPKRKRHQSSKKRRKHR